MKFADNHPRMTTANSRMPARIRLFVTQFVDGVDLIFLRRVGGGYIFIHRLLMEHFAEIYVKIMPKLYELHTLLKAKDPGSGGLVRVMNKRQEFLWVHEKFAGEY